jgi:hypothetical protein
MRPEACLLLGLPENGEERILQRQKELEDILLELDGKISTKAGIRIENKKIILSPLRAEELPSSVIPFLFKSDLLDRSPLSSTHFWNNILCS